MRFVCALLLLLGSTLISKAQGLSGYVVTLTDDTLRGVVVELPKYQKVRLYTGKKAVPQEFTPENIRGYGLLHHAMLRSIPVRLATGGVQRAFVTVAMRGTASLYAYTDQTGLLLAPPAVSDSLYELNQFNWHVLFNRYLTGCASIQHTSSSMLEMGFTEENITRIVHQYNSCQQPGWRSKTFAKGHVWQSGISIRGNYGKIIVSDNHAQQGQRYMLGAEWTGVRASGLQVSTGLHYARIQSNSGFYSAVSDSREPVFEELRGTSSIVSSTIMMGQRWGQPQRVKMYVAAGGGFDVSTGGTTEVWQRPDNNAPSHLTRTDQDGGGILLNVQTQAGAIIPTGSLSELRLVAFYSRYILVPAHLVGLEAAFTLFRK